jgi:cysteine desulfurase
LVAGATLNGPRTERLPNNVNVTLANVFAEQLVLYLDQAGIACSTGSACSYHAHDESHVILALGRTRAEADATIRFTLGRDTTKKDIDYVLKVLPPMVEKIRQVNLSPT